MANEVKITFTGGSLLGEERVLSLETPVLIGRSHSADVRLKEPDVSGRHIELQWVAGGVNAKCLSQHGFQCRYMMLMLRMHLMYLPAIRTLGKNMVQDGLHLMQGLMIRMLRIGTAVPQ